MGRPQRAAFFYFPYTAKVHGSAHYHHGLCVLAPVTHPFREELKTKGHPVKSRLDQAAWSGIPSAPRPESSGTR